MTHSINQPWAISDKFRGRYGDVWADLDFVFNNKISAEVFKEDPMNTEIGYLSISNKSRCRKACKRLCIQCRN